MKNMFNVTTVLSHNLLQTNPCIRRNFSTQVFRKRAAQLHYVTALHFMASNVATNAGVRLQEVVRQNGGHIEHVLH